MYIGANILTDGKNARLISIKIKTGEAPTITTTTFITKYSKCQKSSCISNLVVCAHLGWTKQSHSYESNETLTCL